MSDIFNDGTPARVPPVTLEDYRKQIDAALGYAGGTHTFEDVAALVKSGEVQAWYAPQSVLITELVEYPRLKMCNVFLAGGDLKEIEAMTPDVERWAIAQGCTRAQLIGRRGWSKTFLTRTGWVLSPLEILQKELTGR